MINILYLGDIMADAGKQVVADLLPDLRKELGADIVVAQAENVTDGRGMSVADMDMLVGAGVDFFSGGNWSGYLDELHPRLEDPDSPVIGPTNFEGCPGPGYKYLDTEKGKVLFVTLMGQVVGKPLPTTHNPLHAIDDILEAEGQKVTPAAIVVNFHGDFSSEKRIIGYYLDGRASMVVGDHWHVPTADAMVLPKGTAHITDVGMCGSIHSSLGVSLESVLPRWKDNKQTRNIQDSNKPWQLNAVLVEVGPDSLALSAEQVQRIVK